MERERIEVPTTWTPEEAITILGFVDGLLDAIWHAYGPVIRRHEELHGPPPPPDCPEADPDDIPF
ncbi:MAG: hypothetical protein O2816_17490 [Planctomycetota bacterium]|nr:hypothetical protein [Planctomycetota bacterium]